MKNSLLSLLFFSLSSLVFAQNIAIDKSTEMLLPFKKKTAITGFNAKYAELGVAKVLKEKSAMDMDIVLVGKFVQNSQVTVVLYGVESKNKVAIKIATFAKGKLLSTKELGYQNTKEMPALLRAYKKNDLLIIACASHEEKFTPITRYAKIDEKGETSVSLAE